MPIERCRPVVSRVVDPSAVAIGERKAQGSQIRHLIIKKICQIKTVYWTRSDSVGASQIQAIKSRVFARSAFGKLDLRSVLIAERSHIVQSSRLMDGQSSCILSRDDDVLGEVAYPRLRRVQQPDNRITATGVRLSTTVKIMSMKSARSVPRVGDKIYLGLFAPRLKA